MRYHTPNSGCGKKIELEAAKRTERGTMVQQTRQANVHEITISALTLGFGQGSLSRSTFLFCQGQIRNCYSNRKKNVAL